MSERSVARWLDDRIGWSERMAPLRARRVVGIGIVRLLAALAAFLFLVLVVSGVALMLWYRPDPAQAHASMTAIATTVPFGALVRGVHRYSGELVVAVAYAYGFALLARAEYRPPRELVWLASLVVVVLLVGAAATGEMLPADRGAMEHAAQLRRILGALPIVGDLAVHLVMGRADEASLHQASLHKAYSMHVAVLPALLTVIMLTVRALYERQPEEEGKGAAIPLVPDFVVRALAVCAGVLWLVVTLATFVPPSLGAPGAADAGAAGAPWYLAAVDVVSHSPRVFEGTVLGVFIVCALLPFLAPKAGRTAKILSWLALAVWAGLTIHGLA